MKLWEKHLLTCNEDKNNERKRKGGGKEGGGKGERERNTTNLTLSTSS